MWRRYKLGIVSAVLLDLLMSRVTACPALLYASPRGEVRRRQMAESLRLRAAWPTDVQSTDVAIWSLVRMPNFQPSHRLREATDQGRGRFRSYPSP
jgi:hypothetical protein